MKSSVVFTRGPAWLAAMALVSVLAACGHRGLDRPDEPSGGRGPHAMAHGDRPQPGVADLLAFGPGGHGRPGHEAPLSAEDATRRREQFTTRVTRELNLNAAQQTQLGVLADALDRQRKRQDALRGDAQTPTAQGPLHWMRGATFDRVAAQAELDARIAAMKTDEPALLTAAANFFDSLQPEQQTQVRALLERRGEHEHRRPHGPR